MVPEANFSNVVPAELSTSVRAATTTLAPLDARPRQMARPMPRLPPVTSATLSCNVIMTPPTDGLLGRSSITLPAAPPVWKMFTPFLHLYGRDDPAGRYGPSGSTRKRIY